MHGLTDIVVATERKTQVTHTTTDMSTRQVFVNPSCRTDKISGIGIMLFHPRSHSQHVGVEDNIQGVHSHFLRQQTIGPLGNCYTTLVARGLALFIETHHHHSSTIALYVASMFQELLLTLFQRDRVHDAFSLHTLQARTNHLPVRGVDHHRHLSDIGLCSNHIQEVHHLGLGIKQAVIHIDINHEGTITHLLTGNANSLIVTFFLYQSQELARASHVTAFTHVHELHLGRYLQQLQTREPHIMGLFHWHMRLLVFYQRHIGSNECLIRTTAATDNVYQSLIYEFAHLRRHRLCRLIIEPHRIGQSSIGIGTDIIRCALGEFTKERFHLRGTKRAVQSYGEDLISTDAGKKSVERLTTQRTTCQIAHRHGNHNRQFYPSSCHHTSSGIDSHLRIQRVENGFYQQGVHPTRYQGISLFLVGCQKLVIRQFTFRRITHIGRHRTSLVGGSHRTSHESRFLFRRELIRHLSRNPGPLKGHLICFSLQMIVGLRDALTTECVGGNDICPCLQIQAVDIGNHIGTRQREHVVVTLHLTRKMRKTVSPEVFFRKTVSLYLRTHRPIEDEYPFPDYIVKSLQFSIFNLDVSHRARSRST